MPQSALTGTRIRERRTLLGLKQAELAREVAISPSYLNLIEHNRRRIAGKLLSEIARVLQVEVSALTQGAQAELLEQLSQAVADMADAAAETDRMDEFAGRFPGWATMVQMQHRRMRDLEERIEALGDRLSHDSRLAAAMHEVLSKVTAIRSASSILIETEDIDEAWQRRFHRNLHADSLALTESAQDLVNFLDSEGASSDAYATPWEEVERYLESRHFHLPELEAVEEAVDAALPRPDDLSAPAQSILRDYMDRYRREAVQLPLDRVTELLQGDGDPLALARDLNLPMPLVLRRLAAAPDLAGRDAVGMVHCDGTGTIKLRKSTNGFLVPRSGTACPLWPLYEALSSPGRPVIRVVSHSSSAGSAVRAFAVAEPTWPMGAAGPTLMEVWMVVIPLFGAASSRAMAQALPVGSACRICALPDCVARQAPSLLATSHVASTRRAPTV